MTTHSIPLALITSDGISKFGTPKKGTRIQIINDELHVPADGAKAGKTRHHVYVPGKFKLPFRIDMTVKVTAIQTPPIEMNLYIGNGKVHFEGGHISCNDVLTVSNGSTVGDFGLTSFIQCNALPMQNYADISVTFGSELMWITVDNACCYASNKMPYMALLRDSAVPDGFTDGAPFSICAGSNTKLTIKSLTVTEYENDEPDIPDALLPLPELSPFDLYVKGLPNELHEEMFKTDQFLMNDMKNILKFKRTIDKHGHLTYQSPCGLQYGMTYFGTFEAHGTNWVQSAKKPDYTGDVLNKLSESSPELAMKLFSAIAICNPHTRECKRRTTIAFKGESKQVCRSAISFEWNPSGFADLRKLVAAASKVIYEKLSQ